MESAQAGRAAAASSPAVKSAAAAAFKGMRPKKGFACVWRACPSSLSVEILEEWENGAALCGCGKFGKVSPPTNRLLSKMACTLKEAGSIQNELVPGMTPDMTYCLLNFADYQREFPG